MNRVAGRAAVIVLLAILLLAGFSVQLGRKPLKRGLITLGCSVVITLVSMVVIRGLMEYVRKHSFSAFGVYRIVLGAIVLAYFLLV